jgi:hypothetical protein
MMAYVQNGRPTMLAVTVLVAVVVYVRPYYRVRRVAR